MFNCFLVVIQSCYTIFDNKYLWKTYFFFTFRICGSQTPNDKIVGKTQGNVYFFSVNGYQTSNTSYHTLLKFPLSPFFNVDICEA